MNDINECSNIGILTGTIEKAYIVVKEIPRKDVANETGVGLYIGGDDQNELQ